MRQGPADFWIATELQRAVQRNPPSCLGPFDDLEHVFRHVSALLGFGSSARASIGQEVKTAKPSYCG